MIKKCSGCGILLQIQDENQVGFTPDINNEYCQRCFKIKNYNVKIVVESPIKNEQLIELINKRNCSVVFLLDFFNIYAENINLYRQIKSKKILVLTKSDLIPRNIIKEKFITNLYQEYEISEDIIWVSSIFRDNINQLKNFIKEEKKVIFLGTTNVGKSSLINVLTESNLTTSKNSNTTLDLIKIKTEEGIIYDAPGFNIPSYIDGISPKKRVNPRVYQLKSKYMLQFLDMTIKSDKDNNLVFYIPGEVVITKRNVAGDFNMSFNVMANSDVIIKGLGFINVKEECIISLNIDSNLVEVRRSLVGGKNE